MTDEERRQIEMNSILKMSGVIVPKKTEEAKKPEKKPAKRQTKGAKK